MNRRQLLSRAFKGQVRLLELQRQHNWDRNTLLTATGLLDDPYPFTLHFTAFMAVIEAQGTQEQVKEWIPRCETMQILGCYAQTEYFSLRCASDNRLGHGSNVQGLETTATYIPSTDEFEINSPTLTVPSLPTLLTPVHKMVDRRSRRHGHPRPSPSNT